MRTYVHGGGTPLIKTERRQGTKLVSQTPERGSEVA